MKNRTLLSLIEMLIMVMVFSVSAAICLRAFVFADRTSRSTENIAEAALRAQSAAELMQRFHGSAGEAAAVFGGSVDNGSDPDDNLWTAGFDEDWKLTGPLAGAAFVLEAEETGGTDLLGEGTVRVRYADGGLIFEIPVCWQKEADDER
ncbi:MAG: hypothetical protein IJ930_08520 [Lachnospiraceae bacterium]|nr:hypothetical protein [Lachnospiraceae bacterium]